MISKFYQYLYYRLYDWNLKKWGESDFPQINAMFGVSAMMFMNLLMLIYLLKFFRINTLNINLPDYYVILIGTIIAGINYFVFVHKKKYEQIVQLYRFENSKSRVIKKIYLWIYVIISFFSLVTFAFLSKP